MVKKFLETPLIQEMYEMYETYFLHSFKLCTQQTMQLLHILHKLFCCLLYIHEILEILKSNDLSTIFWKQFKVGSIKRPTAGVEGLFLSDHLLSQKLLNIFPHSKDIRIDNCVTNLKKPKKFEKSKNLELIDN